MSTLVTRLCTITGRAIYARTRTRYIRMHALVYVRMRMLRNFAPSLKVAMLNSLSNDTTGRRRRKKKKKEKYTSAPYGTGAACGNTRKPITQPARDPSKPDALHAIPCNAPRCRAMPHHCVPSLNLETYFFSKKRKITSSSN